MNDNCNLSCNYGFSFINAAIILIFFAATLLYIICNWSPLSSLCDATLHAIQLYLNMEYLNYRRVFDFKYKALDSWAPKLKLFYSGGPAAHDTTERNYYSYRKYTIIPKLLKDVSKRTISTEILGEKVSMPVGIAPTALHKLAHPEGELGSAKAAGIAGIIFIHSSYSCHTIAEVAKAAPKAIKWQQLSIEKDRNFTIHMVREAEKAGFKALVVTVDNPVYPDAKLHLISLNAYTSMKIYEDYYRSKELKIDLPNLLSRIMSTVDDSLSWEDISWLKSITKLPIVVKGILTPEDALQAVRHGASAIYVSNHGGRQLESAPTTLDVLPDVVAAVGDKVEVYIDGGIRDGVDIYKVLALGAKMGCIGRPILWGLANGGHKAAAALLDVLCRELDETFAISGNCKAGTRSEKVSGQGSRYT